MKHVKKGFLMAVTAMLLLFSTVIQVFAEEEGGFAKAGASTSASAETFEMYCKIAVGILALIVIIALIVLLVRRSKISGKGGKAVNVTLGGVSALLLVVIVVVNTMTSIYAGSINAVFTRAGTNEGTTETNMEDWRGLVTEIADEGMVLMKNENNILPLENNTKINLLGYCAYNPIYSGSGSGSVAATDSITIEQALEDAGFEINSAPMDEEIYPHVEAEGKSLGFFTMNLSIDEPALDTYKGNASFENMKEFSDTAVVVLGRSGGEGYDLTAYEEGDYLELNENEQDLLKKATETFDKVVVILNCANALQFDILDTYDIDACIWTGIPGPYGFESLGRILNGSVNPSGSLVDTWVFDHDSSPVSENFGEQKADNAENSFYVDYVEGIYMGYKWYETAYAEGAVITNTKTGEVFDFKKDYDSIVKYPFGYGLSYTTFDQKIVDGLEDGAVLDPNGTVSVNVEVANTGDVVGKETVQLYLTAPYTEYDKEHAVEKSAVTLIGYAKTGEIQPGESEIVTVEVPVEDFASYDSTYDNGNGTVGAYMLDQGEYTFSVRSDAHTSLDEVTAKLDKDHFYSDKDKRPSDDQQAYNQFDDAARGEYLSRQDGFANYESAMKSVSSSVESTEWEDDTNVYDDSYDQVVTEPLKKGVDYARKGDMTLEDVRGLDYDDPKWQELLSQLTVEEMRQLVTDALYKTPSLYSIGKGGTTDSDGPLGISSMFNPAMNSVAYPCIPILAATFNDELAFRFGAYVADQAHEKNVTGWYAPAMDMHRFAYSGRNYEYYSEDSVLSGGIAASTVSGARDRGMIVYIKHFALNDQETCRATNLHTYSNEQAIREIYLKPFETAVKKGGANAIMTSMNFIGDIYAGGHEGLLTEVLRNEWGFRGKSLTDMDEGGQIANIDKTMRAGTDTWLAVGAAGFTGDASDADIYYLQRMAHNALYAEANSVTIQAQIVNWHMYLYIVCAELAALILINIAALVIRNKKKKPDIEIEK